MSNRPMATLKYVTKGKDGKYKRFDLGAIWPAKLEGLAPSFSPFSEEEVKDANPKYPRMTIEDAVKRLRKRDGFINLDAPKGQRLVVQSEDESPSSSGDDF